MRGTINCGHLPGLPGSPVAVEAIADINSTDVSEKTFCLLRDENGTIASLSASVRSPVDVVATLIGSESKITITRFLAASTVELCWFDRRETLRRDFPSPDG